MEPFNRDALHVKKLVEKVILEAFMLGLLPTILLFPLLKVLVRSIEA